MPRLQTVLPTTAFVLSALVADAVWSAVGAPRATALRTAGLGMVGAVLTRAWWIAFSAVWRFPRSIRQSRCASSLPF